MIEAGAAGVHFEDQLSSAKKCGHLGGKVVVPIREFVDKLMAARLAAEYGIPISLGNTMFELGVHLAAALDMAIAAETSGATLNASVFGGFPHADIPHISCSAVIVCDRRGTTHRGNKGDQPDADALS